MSTENCAITQHKVLNFYKTNSYPQNIVLHVKMWIIFPDKSLDYLFQTDEKGVV